MIKGYADKQQAATPTQDNRPAQFSTPGVSQIMDGTRAKTSFALPLVQNSPPRVTKTASRKNGKIIPTGNKFGPLQKDSDGEDQIPDKVQVRKTSTPNEKPDSGNITETTFDGAWGRDDEIRPSGSDTEFESATSDAESTILEFPDSVKV